MGGVNLPSNNYVKFIKSALQGKELLSNDITDLLTRKFKITKNYARKLLATGVRKGQIYSSFPLVFLGGGQYGYSLTPGNNQYINLLDNKPRLKVVYYKVLNYRIISKYEVLKLAGVINDVGTKYYDFGKVIADLKYFFPSLEERTYEGSSFLVYDLPNEEFIQKCNELLGYRLFEAKFIPTIMYYSQSINLIHKTPHYISIDRPFEGVEIRQRIMFDATAFTAIGNPNMECSVVVFDIKINETYNDHDYQGFKWRVDTLINSTQKYHQRVIPVIVVKDIENGTFTEIKKVNNYIFLKLSNIFGSHIQKLFSLLKQQNFYSLQTAVEALEIINVAGLSKQLSSFLPFIFESFVGEIINKVLVAKGRSFTYTRSKIVHLNGKHIEFDVWFEDDDEVIAVECKYHKKNQIVWESYDSFGKLDNHCAKYFFDYKYKRLIESMPGKHIYFIMVAANGFHESTIRNVNLLSSEMKYPIFPLIMSGIQLIELCNEQNVGIAEYKRWLEKVFIKEISRDDTTDIDIDF